MLTDYLSSIANILGTGNQVSAAAMPTPELVSEPTLSTHASTISPKRRCHLEPAPRQHSAEEHAQALLDWINANIDQSEGPITHSAIIEFYTEMLIERNWAPRPWNPVAHQFRLLTTGNRKVYAWITTTTGALHRLRVYPIPAPAVDAASSAGFNCNQVGSRGSSTLPRTA